MQVGYFSIGIGPAVNPEFVRTIATTAERLGFSTIWAPEHVVLLEEYASKYPYSSGKFPAPVDTPIADPFTTLAYAAACTSKIRLGTGICLVPEHTRSCSPRRWPRSIDLAADGLSSELAWDGWLKSFRRWVFPSTVELSAHANISMSCASYGPSAAARIRASSSISPT